MGMQTISLNGPSTGSQRAGLGPQRALNGQLVLSTGTLPIVEPGVGWGCPRSVGTCAAKWPLELDYGVDFLVQTDTVGRTPPTGPR